MFDWTEARLATLRECVRDRKSSGYTAKLLGDEAGVKLTRNAVTSKAKKLGLTFNSRNEPKPKQPVRRRRNTRHSEETLAQYAGGERLPPVEFTPDPASVDADAIPVGQRASLLELTNFTCRFPYGQPGTETFFFCGAPGADNAAGIVYCPLHSRIAYSRPPKPQQRARAA